MKKTICTFILLIMISIANGMADTTLAVGDLWPPWNSGVEGKEPINGIAVDIAKEIFSNAGIKCNMTLYPWLRCLAMMKSGKADIAWFLTKNNEREQYMTFSEPLHMDPYLIFYPTGKPFNWENWSDLKGKKIGITSGFNYGDEFWKAAEKYNYSIITSYTDEITIKNLLADRIELAVLNRSIAIRFMSDNPEYNDQIRSSSKPVSESVYYMAFSKKSDKLYLLEKINAAIIALKKNGTIERITKKKR
jgi:polar amino acid transport system substrate-binding protein